jgi:hypothetical protein
MYINEYVMKRKAKKEVKFLDTCLRYQDEEGSVCSMYVPDYKSALSIALRFWQVGYTEFMFISPTETKKIWI